MKLWSTIGYPKVDHWYAPVDVVHGLAYVLPGSVKAKRILTVHDTSLLDHPEWYPPEARTMASQILYGVEKADKVIVPSDSVRQNLIAKNSNWEHKLNVIPYDVHFKNERVTASQKTEIRKNTLGIDFPYIFWTGEINPRKNIPMLFSVLSGLHQAGQRDIKLVLAGSMGYQSQEILRTAEQYSLRIETVSPMSTMPDADVLLMGYVNDEELSLLYSCAELFLFPSWDEGFGYPVLEAMSCGTPVVSSSLGSLSELCQEAAILIDPNQGSERFVRAIQTLLRDEDYADEWIHKGLNQCKKHKENNMINETLSLYKSVYNTP